MMDAVNQQQQGLVAVLYYMELFIMVNNGCHTNREGSRRILRMCVRNRSTAAPLQIMKSGVIKLDEARLTMLLHLK
jgi:hypothetical protein